LQQADTAMSLADTMPTPNAAFWPVNSPST
jgi:hypothetical protein